MELSPVPIGIGPVPGGGACNRELRRIPIPRTPVNKGKSKGWAMRKPTSNSRREQELLRSLDPPHRYPSER